MFWFSLQLASEKFFILKRPEGDMIINIISVHVKCPLFLSDLKLNLNFNDKFLQNTQISY